MSSLHDHGLVAASESLALLLALGISQLRILICCPIAAIAKISLVVKEVIFIIALEITKCLFIMISSSGDFLIFLTRVLLSMSAW